MKKIQIPWTKIDLFTPENLNFRALQAYLFYGNKGNGKSLFTAYLFNYLLETYYWQEKKYPYLQKRQVWSNQAFGKEVEEKELGNHLMYWSHPKQLDELRNSDIIWDEIGKDIPAMGWKDMPKYLRQVFSHLRKRGNRIFANTQVYNDIDVSFRRQCDRTFKMVKVIGSPDISASLPPVKHPWGIIVMYEMDKNSLETQDNLDLQKQRAVLIQIPKFLVIRKKWINMYDTKMEIPAWRADKLAHIEKICEKCGKVHIDHEPY